ncbi:uncharacterized protein LOC108673341 [Hyalella azteca]|uniref:Uncharacterized protein LOC108673341 n=1 Tax=Hyalella azteca TaxID=294128 RepID=A0A8B7NSE7_HYAAZ|nr:uncharacterized protein LOC108673341 [Hyalella azteca]
MVPRYPHTSIADNIPGPSLNFRGTLPPEIAQDAIVYVLAVVVFYAAIIVVLVGTNLHRFRTRPAEATLHHQIYEDKTKKKPKTIASQNVKVSDEGEIVLAATDDSHDLDSHNEETVIAPLITNNEHEEENAQQFKANTYIESIEVIHQSENNQTYTHTFIDPSLLVEGYSSDDGSNFNMGGESNVRSFPSRTITSGRNSLRDASRSFTTQILQKVRKFAPQTAVPQESSVSKISTTVVSRNHPSAANNQKQNVEVAFTAKEEIKPRALLEMAGDDEVDPVSV